MNCLDAVWLAERMASVLATPMNPYTVLTNEVDGERMQKYVSTLQDAFGSKAEHHKSNSAGSREPTNPVGAMPVFVE